MALNEGGPVVVYGVPFLSDRPLELPRGGQSAVFEAVTLEAALTPVDQAGLQSRPVSSAHAGEMMIQTDGEFEVNLPGQRWSLHIGQEISFHWESGNRILRYEVHQEASLDDFTYWSVHLVLPMFLALEGIVQILHGGCVTHDGGAVMFIAPSFGGKSTLVNAFLERGHRLVSDDKVPLVQTDAGWTVIPSHPMHRPYRGRRDMGQPAAAVAETPQKLTAIYALDIDEHTEATSFTPLEGQAALAQLLKSHLFQVRFLRARGLEFLGELARTVPMYTLRTPRDLERLLVLHDEIVGHIGVSSSRTGSEAEPGPEASP